MSRLLYHRLCCIFFIVAAHSAFVHTTEACRGTRGIRNVMVMMRHLSSLRSRLNGVIPRVRVPVRNVQQVTATVGGHVFKSSGRVVKELARMRHALRRNFVTTPSRQQTGTYQQKMIGELIRKQQTSTFTERIVQCKFLLLLLFSYRIC